MSKFDFGEEQLKFLFERWNMNGNLSELDKQAKANIKTTEEGYQHLLDIEARMKKYMVNLEKWVEGNSNTSKDDNEEE
ncbi:hypothetical protein [Sutcliffiella rhizosphaerae]|uniref:Uncharacterized protein n=1 Tax=Sutcliffiella rhizosphaerae TaxID=2880967 RepID=A0ABM8YKS3_9BACI|nr:hypothetical protein [Sutcliffiella rhizosphaerae]CAG9620471.1 hypothetical protein BACCIP111883_01239 [Sutcliffiella rhizosphaerae]